MQGCDASLLLEAADGIESEKASDRSFGMRNFKYVNTIKEALEKECPLTVSCADVVTLSARDGIVMVRLHLHTFFLLLSLLRPYQIIRLILINMGFR